MNSVFYLNNIDMEYPFYKLLPQLPHVPDEIFHSVDLERKPTDMEIGYYRTRKLKNWYGREIDSLVNIRTKHNAFEKWVHENIVKDTIDAGVNYVVYDREDGLQGSTGAHTDGIRNFTVIYNIKTGGPNATTCYWQEHDQDLLRPPKTQGEDLSKLMYWDGIFIPERTWCLLDTRVLHSVEHLTSTRISFQISLNEHSW
jgi:hypothetical protein